MPPQEDVSTRRAKSRLGSWLRDKWRIDKLLGIGGMAAVYAGTHRNGKRGAIKVMHLDMSQDVDAKSRFQHEGYVANRVNHPGVVAVLDDDTTDDGSVFLVMELLEGRSVDGVANERPGQRLAPAEALNIVDQLLDVLAAAHDKGIVHRDLKPENLFLTTGGVVKVLDFGIARIRDVKTNTHATQTGSPMGTPGFMPPEQALGNWNDVDGRSDLWAAGATLFTLLTGRLVHDAANVNQLLLASMTKPAPSLASVLPSAGAPLAELVDRSLAFNRDKRWQSAREMQRALRDVGRALPGFTDAPGIVGGASSLSVDAAVSGSSTPSLLGTTLLREPGAPRSRSRVLGIVAGSIAVLAAAVAAVAMLRAQPAPAAMSAQPTELAPVTTSAPVVTPAGTPADAQGPSPSQTASAAAAPEPPPKTSAAATAKVGPKKPAATATSRDPFLTWE